MKIVVAPDSFKESLTALEAAEAIAEGMRLLGRIVVVPMADGGEGTLDALLAATQGTRYHASVTGPRGTKLRAAYGMLGDGRTGVVEMAQASGLERLPVAQRNPLYTTSYGTGELIAKLVKRGVREILLSLGGSATVDGGIGALSALGVRFLDAKGKPVPAGVRGLLKLAEIDCDAAPKISITIASDVTSNLAEARIYAAQKGAKDLAQIDDALAHLAEHLNAIAGRDIASLPGGGAAGAMGAGFAACLNAKIRSGFDCVAQAAGLERALKGASLVVTGEGAINHQTPRGKTPAGVAALARKHGIPVIAFAGRVDPGAESLFDAVFTLAPRPATIEESIRNAKPWLTDIARQVAHTIKLGKSL